MSATFIAALKKEAAEVEADLASDPRYVRLQKLREMLALYGIDGDAVGDTAATPRAPSAQRERASTRKMSGSRAKILEIASEAIAAGGGDPVPTRDVFEWVAAQGAEIPGKSPVNNLSAMLSNSEQFVSHGRAGWVLATLSEIDFSQDDGSEPLSSSDVSASDDAEPDVPEDIREVL